MTELISKYIVDFVSIGNGTASKESEIFVTGFVKPCSDIREEPQYIEPKNDVLGIEDLKEGMVITDTVRYVINFGALLDVGVHQNGLVHISEIYDR